MRMRFFPFPVAGKDPVAKPFDWWDQKEQIEQERAARVQDQVVDIAGAHHKSKLDPLNGADAKQDRRQKYVPSSLQAEKPRQEERKRHEGADIADQI